jgi:hypothetical protein
MWAIEKAGNPAALFVGMVLRNIKGHSQRPDRATTLGPAWCAGNNKSCQ